MFTKPLDILCSIKNLEAAFEHLNPKARGIDRESFESYKSDLHNNLQTLRQELLNSAYTPQPMERIEIAKEGKNEKRPISLSSVRDKIVQATLSFHLGNYFDETFSDKSYAYRSGKSHIKALNRTKGFLEQKNHWVLKTDVDDFFETINHDLLLELLGASIKDRRIIRLISLLMQNGIFHRRDYIDHDQGVHQGDSLSPLLSNIYLNEMDRWLENEQILFVRFADDFAVFCKSQEECARVLQKLKSFLGERLKLRLGEDKTRIVHVNDGFNFLGARFHGQSRQIDPERLDKAIKNLLSLAEHHGRFEHFIDKLSATVKTLKRYYTAIVAEDSPQIEQLQNALIESVSRKIVQSKSGGFITSKAAFKTLLEPLYFVKELTAQAKEATIELIIARAYDAIEAQKSLKADTAPLEKKKEEYSKKLTGESHLHVTHPGVVIGIAKNRITLKENGKIIKSLPKNQLTHIIVASDGVSLSSNLIRQCARDGIPIDLIDRNHQPYASFVSFEASLTQNALMQLEIFRLGKQMEFATEFIEGKAKNQINYLKYLDKYHKRFEHPISQMQQTLKKSKNAQTANELMGYEGQISSLYWQNIVHIVDPSYGFSGRVTQGARDPLNSALNYGYAILYGKVRSALVKAGLSLHVSYLHALDGRKPTLVFDMVEEFRAFIVDRVVIAMAAKNEPIKVTKEGLLTDETKSLLAQNLFERFGSYTLWHKEQHKIEHLITHQAYALARAVRGEEKYAAFIGKY